MYCSLAICQRSFIDFGKGTAEEKGPLVKMSLCASVQSEEEKQTCVRKGMEVELDSMFKAKLSF